MAAAAEIIADEFDRDLYRLIDKAHYLADHGVKPHKERWRRVAMALQSARPDVRSMMDPRRRVETN